MSRRAPTLAAVVLAAGPSKRFRSSVPKVLHNIAGRTLVGHVLESLRLMDRPTRPRTAVCVVSPGRAVAQALNGTRLPFPLSFAVQRVPKGTGDATRIALRSLAGADEVLVIAGDMPLIRPATLSELVRTRREAGAAAGVLTAVVDEPGDFGRVLRDGGDVRAIVEARDASPVQLAVREVNTSVYVFDRTALDHVLPKLRSENAQGELYLTDAIQFLVDAGESVVAVAGAPEDAIGANTRWDFALAGAELRRRAARALAESGVTIVDPGTTSIDPTVTVGPETVILPMTVLEGTTRVGSGCQIGPSTRLVDTTVGDGAHVTFAVAIDARIGPEAEVGPYASLRPGTVLKRGAKAGTFVEMKEAEIGEGAKVPHLSYMGDVTVGRGSNVGAGTITCNYDGKDKHQTKIGEDAFVGSNTTLVAPVRVGRGAYTGAGSVVTRDVKAGQLVYGNPAKPRTRTKNTQKRGRAAGAAPSE